jgi:hypothetical protein
MFGKMIAGVFFGFFAVLALTTSPAKVFAQAAIEPAPSNELEQSFQAFLPDYWEAINKGDKAFLKSVHPKLPAEMYDFFFEVTRDMMAHSEKESLSRSMECQDYKVCKIVYPQPNDSWAAQQFIQHEGRWRWLDQ